MCFYFALSYNYRFGCVFFSMVCLTSSCDTPDSFGLCRLVKSEIDGIARDFFFHLISGT